MAEIIKHDDVEGQLKVQELAGLAKGHFVPSRGVISRKIVAAAEQADEIIQEARETANQFLKQARELKKRMASRVKTERKKGYDKGYQEGLAQVTEQLAAATTYREQTIKDAESEVVAMVFQIVEKILGDAVKKGAVVAVVQQALLEAVGERVTVRVNPEDLDLVRAKESELREKTPES